MIEGVAGGHHVTAVGSEAYDMRHGVAKLRGMLSAGYDCSPVVDAKQVVTLCRKLDANNAPSVY